MRSSLVRALMRRDVKRGMTPLEDLASEFSNVVDRVLERKRNPFSFQSDAWSEIYQLQLYVSVISSLSPFPSRRI